MDQQKQSCGQCKAWTPQPGVERTSCAAARCSNEQAISFGLLTQDGDGESCNVWKPVDALV